MCGVVALCYDVDNKVPKLIAWRRGKLQVAKWEIAYKKLRTTVLDVHVDEFSGRRLI